MSRKKQYMTELAEVSNFCCKYSKKAGYKVCPVQFKICFLQTSMDIVVYSNDKKHIHDKDPEYSTPINFHWTETQETIIRQGIRDVTRNKLIL